MNYSQTKLVKLFVFQVLILALIGCSEDEGTEIPKEQEFNISVDLNEDPTTSNKITLSLLDGDVFATINGIPEDSLSVDIEMTFKRRGGSSLGLDSSFNATVINESVELSLDSKTVDFLIENFNGDEVINFIVKLEDYEYETQLLVFVALNQIYSWNDLKYVPNYLEQNFKLMNDIILPNPGESDMPLNGFPVIAPDTISTNDTYDGLFYSGSFNGQGYLIKNLYIDRENEDYIGLFGYVTGRVLNLNVELSSFNTEFSIRGRNRVGGIAGIMGSGEKIEVKNGTIVGKNGVGGIAGGASFIDFSGALETKVVGDTIVGGVYGSAFLASLNRLFFEGEVEGKENVGGIGGAHTVGSLNNCYVIANISGNTNVGGMVGFSDITFRNNYVIPAFINEPLSAGIFGGVVFTSQDLSNVYYDNPATEYELAGDLEIGLRGEATPLNLTEMTSQASYPTGWDFDDTWTISTDKNNGFPYLRNTSLDEDN